MRKYVAFYSRTISRTISRTLKLIELFERASAAISSNESKAKVL